VLSVFSVAMFCLPLMAQTRVLLETEVGAIEIEVDSAKAPVTSANFLKYVNGGYYDGGVFHRAVRTKPDNQPNSTVKIEVIQAGPNPAREKEAFPPIALERTSQTGLRHKDGVVSMARTGPDSATGDFFVCVGDQPELDFGGKRNADGQGFAAFGRVVRGMEIVRRIHQSPVEAQKLTPPLKILSAAVSGSRRALLRQNLDRIMNGVKADWGVYIKSLESGEEIAINADAVMDTMSTIKVPLLVEAFRQVDEGKLKLDSRIEMKRADQRFGTGVMRTLDPGLHFTLKDLLTLMIIQSDNSATDMVFEQVGGPKRVSQTMREMGLTNIIAPGTSFEWFRALGAASDPAWMKTTREELFVKGYPSSARQADRERFHFQGKTPYGLASPRDLGRLLGKIADGSAATPASCNTMLRILRQQQMNTRIPKYLTGVGTPHKTGDFPPYIANDVGLIESQQSRTVVVFFSAHHRGIYANLEDAIARMSEQVWLLMR